jgi:hypothetical protein
VIGAPGGLPKLDATAGTQIQGFGNAPATTEASNMVSVAGLATSGDVSDSTSTITRRIQPPLQGTLAGTSTLTITTTAAPPTAPSGTTPGTTITDSTGATATVVTISGTGPYTVTLSGALTNGVVTWPVSTVTLADVQPGTWAAGVTTAIGKWSGISSLANWLRAIMRSSTPDSTALSEINAGGGTYDPTAKALQAITAGGTTVVNVLPGNVVSANGRTITTLPPASEHCFYQTTFPIIDQSGNPINLTGVALTMEFWDPNTPNTIALTAATTGTTDATISVGGTSHNQITLTIQPAATANKADWTWRLRPTANTSAPYTSGKLSILAGPPTT